MHCRHLKYSKPKFSEGNNDTLASNIHNVMGGLFIICDSIELYFLKTVYSFKYVAT